MKIAMLLSFVMLALVVNVYGAEVKQAPATSDVVGASEDLNTAEQLFGGYGGYGGGWGRRFGGYGGYGGYGGGWGRGYGGYGRRYGGYGGYGWGK